MRTAVVVAGLLGLFLFTGLILWEGAGDVATALATAGWGLAAVTLFHLVPLLADTAAWRLLFPPAPRRPGFSRVAWARWIGDAVNNLLPAAQVGGTLLRARLVSLSTGVSGNAAGAATIADLTLIVFTQILFTLAGVGILVSRLGRHEVVSPLLWGLVAFTSLAGAFYLLQRRGMFGGLAQLLSRVAGGRTWPELLGGAEALDGALDAVYRRRGTLLGAGALNLAAWIVGTGEVWLAMYFLGAPVSLAEAFLLESLGQAVRAAAFFVPAAIGVQEGTYVFLGALLGIPGEVALALSLVKRVRELAFGVPGLLAWQVAEGKRLVRE